MALVLCSVMLDKQRKWCHVEQNIDVSFCLFYFLPLVEPEVMMLVRVGRCDTSAIIFGNHVSFNRFFEFTY